MVDGQAAPCMASVHGWCMGLVKIKGNIHVYILIEGIYRSVYILQCIECWTHSVQMGIETDRQSLRKDIQYSLKTLI